MLHGNVSRVSGAPDNNIAEESKNRAAIKSSARLHFYYKRQLKLGAPQFPDAG